MKPQRCQSKLREVAVWYLYYIYYYKTFIDVLFIMLFAVERERERDLPAGQGGLYQHILSCHLIPVDLDISIVFRSIKHALFTYDPNSGPCNIYYISWSGRERTFHVKVAVESRWAQTAPTWTYEFGPRDPNPPKRWMLPASAHSGARPLISGDQ